LGKGRDFGRARQVGLGTVDPRQDRAWNSALIAAHQYDRRAGSKDRKAGPFVTQTWHPLVSERDFPEDGKLATTIGGWYLLIAKAGDGIFAVNDRCTHQAAQLSPGRIRRGVVMCPLHGARFEINGGKCIGGAYKDLRTFPVRTECDMIEVCVPDEAPGMDERPIML
jgi:anthranilate 1,2-dioxygenase ferredoxin component